MWNKNRSISLKSFKLKIWNDSKKENEREKRRPFCRSGQLSTDSERERWNIPLLRSNLEPNSSDHCCTVERTVEQRFLLLATLTLSIGKGRVRGNGNGNVVAKSRCKVFLLSTSLHSVAPTLHYAAVSWKHLLTFSMSFSYLNFSTKVVVLLTFL